MARRNWIAELVSQPRDPREKENEVLDLLSRADKEAAGGTTNKAVQLYSAAITIVRQLVKDHPDDPDHIAMLGSVLYRYSNLLSTVGRGEEALTAIAECEDAYSRLPQTVPVCVYLADVTCRRGMIHESLGHGASAVADLQQAVQSYFALSASNPDSPHYLDWARVLSNNAAVLARFGDPDLAVASADTAIRIFLSQRDKVNARSDSLVYAKSARQALAVAAVIHKIQGRKKISDEAADLGRRMDGAPPTMDEFICSMEEHIDGERPKFTLASAVAAAATLLGSDRVTDLLGQDKKTLDIIPLDRCGVDVAPLVATHYAKIAMEVLPRDPNAGLRLGLEAHYLFAGSSRAQTLMLRYQFSEFGPAWAHILLACSQVLYSGPHQSSKALALDLATWARSVATQLAPFASQNAELRPLVPDCLEHYGRLLIETGKETEGKAALQEAAKFSADFPKTPEA